MVPNAGIGTPQPIVETSLADWRRVTSVNLDGVFLSIRYAAPAIIASGGGSIINLSSITSTAGSPLLASYAASKAAVRNLTQTAAIELRPHGARVNALLPATPMSGSCAVPTTGPRPPISPPRTRRNSLNCNGSGSSRRSSTTWFRSMTAASSGSIPTSPAARTRKTSSTATTISASSTTWSQPRDPSPPASIRCGREFAYDGGGLGKSGKVTLYYDGKPVGTGSVDKTQPMASSADEACDVGADRCAGSLSPRWHCPGRGST
jgi:NAD(P)-dependent dehydrogenase (short-subunit alcohol dehydrogenase family)